MMTNTNVRATRSRDGSWVGPVHNHCNGQLHDDDVNADDADDDDADADNDNDDDADDYDDDHQQCREGE